METRTGQTRGSDLVLEFFHALEEQDYDRAARFLSNDFVFTGPMPKDLDSKEFLDMQRHLSRAIPDWRFNFELEREDEKEVIGRVHITGTHTGELTLPGIQGLGTIQPTGKRISLPSARVLNKVKGNKITRHQVDATPQTGLAVLLQQIGVDVHELAL